jgi:hypothetical protein
MSCRLRLLPSAVQSLRLETIMANFAPSVFALTYVGALFLPQIGQAAADDVAGLRAELDALKNDYGMRVGALEERIRQLEAEAAGSQAAATLPAAPPAPPPVPARASSASAFNPAISMILSGNYSNLQRDPSTYRIAGFIPPPSGAGPGSRSFNLDESELTVAANVDPYFFANVTAAIQGDDSIEVEEAYFKTLTLNHGLTLKGGRFFSGVGYLNEVHSHAWDFVDQPLVYQALLGSQRSQDGAQLRWVASTDLLVEMGAEAGNGRGFPGSERNSNGLSGLALFTHLGGDIGDSTSWRVGASWLDDRSEDRRFDDADRQGFPVSDSFTGRSRTWIVDATLKWAPHGDPTQHQLKLQGEFIHRDETGQLAYDVDLTNLSNDYDRAQYGWYVQAVYQFMPRWRAGLRYDSLHSGTPDSALADFLSLQRASPQRTTFMLDWNLSEFSRLRAQYAWDEARANESDREFRLQYIFAIGAHGAHKF